MKYRTTQKQIKNNYFAVSVGYCDLQDLLRFEEPEAYTCGAYGWNADIYAFGGVAIVTGYRPFGNFSFSHDRIRFFEDEAKKINHNREISYEDQKSRVSGLLADLIGEIREAIRNSKK